MRRILLVGLILLTACTKEVRNEIIICKSQNVLDLGNYYQDLETDKYFIMFNSTINYQTEGNYIKSSDYEHLVFLKHEGLLNYIDYANISDFSEIVKLHYDVIFSDYEKAYLQENFKVDKYLNSFKMSATVNNPKQRLFTKIFPKKKLQLTVSMMKIFV